MLQGKRSPQSFCAALEEELLEYQRLLVILETQLLQRTAAVREAHVHARAISQLRLLCSGHCAPPAEDSSQRLTLKRLLVWLLEPQERLKMLAMVVDACRGRNLRMQRRRRRR